MDDMIHLIALDKINCSVMISWKLELVMSLYYIAELVRDEKVRIFPYGQLR